jgi:AcrR family transcriptional regulator
LQQAALDRFGVNGYDTTTTDEIAVLAGVSPRTFFRYFPTKESVLFVGEFGWFQSFTQLFLAQPPELPDIDALRDTLLTLAPSLTKIRRALNLYELAVASSPTLRGGVHDRQQNDIAQIADAIAVRRGIPAADEACFVLATITLVFYRRAVTLWLQGPASADPRDLIRTEIELVIGALTPPKAPARRRSPSRTSAAATG